MLGWSLQAKGKLSARKVRKYRRPKSEVHLPFRVGPFGSGLWCFDPLRLFDDRMSNRSCCALEELNGALVLFSGGPALKRAEISSPAGLRILLAGIKPILS